MRFLFGGQATFEMAQQLRAQGQTVALLALLNAPAPGYPKPLPYTTAFGRVAQIVNRYWSDLKCLQSFELSRRSRQPWPPISPTPRFGRVRYPVYPGPQPPGGQVVTW